MTYAEDANTFGAHIRHGGDWAYGAIVARWVRVPDFPGGHDAAKVSAERFSRDSHVSANTVRQYVRTWNSGYFLGFHDRPSWQLHPDDDAPVVDLIESAYSWPEAYRHAHRSGGSSKRPPTAKDRLMKFLAAGQALLGDDLVTVTGLVSELDDDRGIDLVQALGALLGEVVLRIEDRERTNELRSVAA